MGLGARVRVSGQREGWCVTVTMVAVSRPESQTPRKTVLAGSHARKAPQCTTSRASSFHFFSFRVYLIESNLGRGRGRVRVKGER